MTTRGIPAVRYASTRLAEPLKSCRRGHMSPHVTQSSREPQLRSAQQSHRQTCGLKVSDSSVHATASKVARKQTDTFQYRRWKFPSVKAFRPVWEWSQRTSCERWRDAQCRQKLTILAASLSAFRTDDTGWTNRPWLLAA
jgi:hypothetical protein